jgi:hypothetical protein
MRPLVPLLLLVALLNGCAFNTAPTVEQAAGADIATTAYGLAHGATEMNPLGFAGTTVLKGLVLLNKEQFTDEQLHLATSVWSGAAVNNLVQIIWAPVFVYSLGLGIITAIYLYNLPPK